MAEEKLTLPGIFEKFLKAMFGEDILDDPNFTETPKRMAAMYTAMIRPKDIIEEVSSSIMSKSFPSRYNGLIVLPQIRTVSFCPHHMLPVEYNLTIGYLPNDSKDKCSVVGASKPERMAHALASTPILQEEYTLMIAEKITESICPKGVGVVMQGFHSCMRVRGIKNPCSNMITSEMTGAFRENPRTQHELMELIKFGRQNGSLF